MKSIKRIAALILSAAMVCAMLCACGGDGAGVAGNAEPSYKVTVEDALGNPYTSGIIVKFLQNGQQAAMQVVGDNGVAEKQLPKGDYTVELQFTSSDTAYYYETEGLTLSADKTELTVVLSYALADSGASLIIRDKEVPAHPVSVGCTYLELNQTDRSYFLFNPNQPGTYQVSVVNSEAAVGYYGAPHFVQELSAAEVVDNAFTLSVTAGMIGTGQSGAATFVIGIDPGQGGAILAIQRTGDPEHTVADEPWTVYQPTGHMNPYTAPAGVSLQEFDLTADGYTLVYNETDGFYHLNSVDGPLILVRLGEVSNGSKYLDSFETILDHSSVNKYFYDEDGNFLKKEKYDDCLLQYFEIMDADTGLYPLTEDLKYIIQSRGEYCGWWEADSSMYLFTDENGVPVPGINPEIAWLFMCCYVE